MDNNQVNFWLSINAANFAPEVLPTVRGKLEQANDTQMMYLQSVSFKKPSTILLIAIFLGWERFFLNDIALGIVKVITGYGCGIWWLIDLFTAKKRAQKYNFEQFQKTTGMMGGGGSTPNNGYTPTPSATEQTPANNNIIVNAEMQPQQYVATPENSGHTRFTTQSIPEKSKNSIIERIKNLFTSPKTMWESIDKDNSLQIGYLLKLAIIPAAALFLGFFFKGIYYAIAIPYGGGHIFGYMLLYGFLSAITAYAIIMILGLLSALVPFLFAEKFGSVKSYNKAFALTAYSMTPLCLLGILLLYPAPFLFWVWLIAGVIYGRYLIYSGTQTLLKTPLEKHTLYVGICADIFFVLAIAFGLILFAELQALQIPRGYSHFYRY